MKSLCNPWGKQGKLSFFNCKLTYNGNGAIIPHTVTCGDDDSFVLICSFHCRGQFSFVIEYSVIKGREKLVYDELPLYVGLPALTHSNQAGSQTT